MQNTRWLIIMALDPKNRQGDICLFGGYAVTCDMDIQKIVTCDMAISLNRQGDRNISKIRQGDINSFRSTCEIGTPPPPVKGAIVITIAYNMI